MSDESYDSDSEEEEEMTRPVAVSAEDPSYRVQVPSGYNNGAGKSLNRNRSNWKEQGAGHSPPGLQQQNTNQHTLFTPTYHLMDYNLVGGAPSPHIQSANASLRMSQTATVPQPQYYPAMGFANNSGARPKTPKVTPDMEQKNRNNEPINFVRYQGISESIRQQHRQISHSTINTGGTSRNPSMENNSNRHFGGEAQFLNSKSATHGRGQSNNLTSRNPSMENNSNRRSGGQAQFSNPRPATHGQGQSNNLDHANILSFSKLQDWAHHPVNSLLIFDMTANMKLLTSFLNKAKLSLEEVTLLLTSFRKIISTEGQKGSVKLIFKSLCESKFFQVHLNTFLFELHRRRASNDVYRSLQNTVDVCEFVIRNVEEYSYRCFQPLTTLLDVGKKLNLFTETSDLGLRVKHLLQKMNRFAPTFSLDEQSQPEPSCSEGNATFINPDYENPPDDFSKMAIFPDTEELFSSIEPFLRANKTKGPYRNLEHYLDVHARLMKEDYLAPLRNGLKHFKLAQQNTTKIKEDDLRFYHQVQIVKISTSDHGISHHVTFDKTPFEELDWEFSRRLMFGSLLVFSKDLFETTIFATVANREVEMLKRGVVEVVFQNNLEEVFTSSEHDDFIMAETTAYFESYRHVLEGLQEMKTLPLEDYIISCKCRIRPPEYVQTVTQYDLSSIVHDSGKFPVTLLNDNEWPDVESTILNESQLEALKLALTKEMAIIQGPPGTGKTYVGLKIMQILLDNKVMKQSFGIRSPILVVCFTNHALDQFLEGILDFCPDGIVRVGSRSSSTRLEEFNLKELRQNPAMSRKIRKNIQTNVAYYRGLLREASKRINRFWQETLRLDTTILNVKDLSEEMTEDQMRSLTDPSRMPRDNYHIMSAWLKASNANMENHLGKAAKRHLAKVIAQGSDLQVDSSVITDKMSAAKADFQTRVRIYRYWLDKYRNSIEELLQLLLIGKNSDQDTRVRQCLSDQEMANSIILSDTSLKPHIDQNVFQAVLDCVKCESKITEDDEDGHIQCWIFNSLTRTDQLLDAVERLTTSTAAKGQGQGGGRGRIQVDTEVKAHEDKWVIEDSDDESESYKEEDSYDEDEEASDMDDVDDGGTINLSDMREIEESFQQSANKDVTMMQRARLLGIDLSETAEEDNPEWQIAGVMSYSRVFTLYHNSVPFTNDETTNIQDLWDLKLKDRYRLYKYWVQEKKKKLTDRLIDLTREYKLVLQAQKEAKSQKDIEILKRARVIGMTTTGAARNRAVLQEVGCRIIVVEEAAEVLEGHIVTTLNKKCQHLILIGDHQQLRPNPTVHKLAVQYQLEISLFERLVNNNIPHVTLNEQHRMRPEISTYLQYIYPNLQDHWRVTRYENIRGVSSNVFFLNHQFDESALEDSTSKANVHEAQFLAKLCKYFRQHGYQGNQITVLAAYGGQVKAIKEELEQEPDVYEHVRVTSIDNYQGEENDIILLSLVRSNAENQVGFLKTDNRVCVALSRAKMGLFVVGNVQMLANKSRFWKNIVTNAQATHVTGVYMKLVCVNHAHHVTYVSNAEDFQKEAPEGGCHRRCDTVLPCGHLCTRMCHASDRQHENTRCEQPCLQTCSEGHACQKECYQECGDCMVLVTKTLPQCGHEDDVPCHQDVDECTCSQTCGETLPCGHFCRGQCGVCRKDEHHHPCLEKVEKEWPCGHKNTVECHSNVSVDPCPEKCKERLECGHKCKGTCGGCLLGHVHKACTEKCKDPLPCGHPCQGPCGGLCIPCQVRCPTLCRHGRCSKVTCGEPCDLCVENCAMVCQHKPCKKRCIDECPDPPCSKTCGKPVPKCGHKCWSLCGELCVCYSCEKNQFSLIDTSNKRKSANVAAFDKQEKAKKFSIGSDTVLMKIPKCGHIFTLNQLDRHMENVEPSTTAFVRCPTCTEPILCINRYEVANKRRAERRENCKDNLIKCNKVSDAKVNSLVESKKMTQDFCSVDEGDFLSTKTNQLDSNHELALTMQIRFAYAVKIISEIRDRFTSDTEQLKRWKRAIKSIQRTMPKQLQKEMTMEIYRLVLLEQIVILGKLIKLANFPLTDELKTNCKAVLRDLSKLKLTSEMKSKAQTVLDIMYNLFYKTSELPADKAKQLKALVRLVTKVLEQPHTEDLHTILFKK